MRIHFTAATIVCGVGFIFLATGAGPGATPFVFDLFEIDGDAVVTTAGKEDWKTLFDGGGTALAYTGVICDYAFDSPPTNCGDGHACNCPVGGDDNVFTGGGSKDINDIDQWKASFKNNPPKDEIDNAYAAFYLDPNSNNDLIAVFGADRLSTDGDAQIGFWFLQSDIKIDHATGNFTGGKHQVNDTLILADFTKGGGTATPKVFKWTAAGTLQDVTAQAEAFSDVNEQAVAAPWTYEHHHEGLGGFPQGAFFEGRVNLTKALGGTTLCFTTFLAETRSSQETTAVLKDLVIGNIDLCAISVSKTCECVGFNDDFTAFKIDFDATVTNTGAGTFPAGSVVTVVDDAGTPNAAGDDVTVTQTLAAPLAPGQSVVLSGQFQSTSNPPFNTVTAKIANSSIVSEADPFGTSCDPCPLDPHLQLLKSCELVLETKANCGLVVRVNFEGSVKNTGNVPLFVTVVDSDAGTVLPLTLIMPDQLIPLSGFYYPTQANGGVTDPCEAMFSDTFTATGTSPFLSQPVTEVITANCPLCPCD